ncbi:hypothetical protein CSX11_19270 [Mycobacterium goodii]|nr:hypothetical protein CSX11_19270 [Mycolicibacterium goodii]
MKCHVGGPGFALERDTPHHNISGCATNFPTSCSVDIVAERRTVTAQKAR